MLLSPKLLGGHHLQSIMQGENEKCKGTMKNTLEILTEVFLWQKFPLPFAYYSSFLLLSIRNNNWKLKSLMVSVEFFASGRY